MKQIPTHADETTIDVSQGNTDAILITACSPEHDVSASFWLNPAGARSLALALLAEAISREEQRDRG